MVYCHFTEVTNVQIICSASKKNSGSRVVDGLKDTEAIASLELRYEVRDYRRNTCYLLAGRLIIKG